MVIFQWIILTVVSLKFGIKLNMLKKEQGSAQKSEIMNLFEEELAI
jgi:hypothetical protein